MKLVWLMLAAFVVCVLTLAVGAEDKKSDKSSSEHADYAKLIVGTWECTKSPKGVRPPVGAVLELDKDRGYTLTIRDRGTEVEGGTYVVNGGKLLFPLSAKDTVTIKKLNDTELVVENLDGDTIEWKRKKGS